MEERLLVDGARLLGVLEQRLDLGREREPAVVDAVVERLDADAVADEPELAGLRVPERDREHAAELVRQSMPHCSNACRMTSVSEWSVFQRWPPMLSSSARISAWL